MSMIGNSSCRVRLGVMLAGVAVAWSCAAATWYVDDDNYGKSGDGTRENPFGTIQEAVDSASARDTIKVAPGLYNRGGKDR